MNNNEQHNQPLTQQDMIAARDAAMKQAAAPAPSSPEDTQEHAPAPSQEPKR